jgi:predicted metalloprotease with PDZ domain
MDPGREPNTFVADNYDTFIDSSIVLGPYLEQTQFDYKGVPHYLAFIGKGNYNKEKITADTRTVVGCLIDLMAGAPYKKYVFFLRARPGQGAGGLEHLNSTDISFPPTRLTQRATITAAIPSVAGDEDFNTRGRQNDTRFLIHGIAHLDARTDGLLVGSTRAVLYQ